MAIAWDMETDLAIVGAGGASGLGRARAHGGALRARRHEGQLFTNSGT